MFSALRTRFGIPGIIATVALVFAMTGGAFAAKYLITSTKQISPSVLKKLKGAAGPAGSAGASGTAGLPGAQGSAGPAGANGKDGAPGAAGATGAAGKSVTTEDIGPFGGCGDQEGVKLKSASGENFVCDGAEGAKGDDGEPWVAGQAPPGVVMKGTWAVHSSNAAKHELIPFSISFTVPVAPTVLSAVLVVPGNPTGQEFCNGDAEDPTPAELGGEPFGGFICLYTASEVVNVSNETMSLNGNVSGAGGGAVAQAEALEAGLVDAYGSWAMYTP